MRLAAIKVADSVQQALDALFGFLPNILGFLVILIIGWLIARVIKTIVVKALQKVGLDRTLHQGQTGQWVERVSPGASPSKLIGALAYWAILIVVIATAVSALKVPALTAFIQQVYGYLPNVIAAVLIFVLAGAISAAIAALVAKTMGDTPTGKVVETAVPGLVMAIAIFMILNQLRIAPEIVTITYAALIGSIALGAALAFGLGGRDVANRMLEDAYRKGQANRDQVRDDLETGKQRGEQRARAEQGRTQRAGPGGAVAGTSTGG